RRAEQPDGRDRTVQFGGNPVGGHGDALADLHLVDLPERHGRLDTWDTGADDRDRPPGGGLSDGEPDRGDLACRGTCQRRGRQVLPGDAELRLGGVDRLLIGGQLRGAGRLVVVALATVVVVLPGRRAA